ncbi:hypothetical protein BGZ76_004254 [Entomortierella beljakovae]|nr:hypothetical protein BGZ76_004254 [Entomortierella beljakovae]
MTSLESGFASMYSQTAGNFVDASIPSLAGAHNIMQPPAVISSQYGHRGMAPSPIENSFSSGSSTPSFASMSPSLSYSNSELGGASCDSSRPTSPMFNQTGSPDGYLSERRLRKFDSESSSQIIRSRKSSTSSTSSNASQRPVLIRHIESIHEKLLWNCVGCKSNLSRRDAVTRHINLSPMDSVCRSVGTIGQIKMINGNEIHYEVSAYRAKPLDEVMSRMGKKMPPILKREADFAKGRNEGNLDTTFGNDCKYVDDVLYRLTEVENENSDVSVKMEECSSEDYEDEAGQKKRRRPSVPTFARKK